MTCSLGAYDLKSALDMEFSKYKEFVAGLFDIELKQFKLNGYKFDGKKLGDPVVIFDYNAFPDANIDDVFLEDLAHRVGNKIKGGRVYIVSPSTRVDFITDYDEIDDVRYYFLKIPYQIIKDLHQRDFKKFRQPKSKNGVNALDESVGFSFNRTPKVKSALVTEQGKSRIEIKEFISEEPRTGKTITEKQMSGFELLSAIFIDNNYNGSEFIMDEYYFYDELLQSDDKIIINLDKYISGNKVMIVYTDIYGNDFTEILSDRRTI